MAVTRELMARLERDASSMGTANHGRYLSEAMQAMRDPVFAADAEADAREAPLRALRLLEAMWGGAFASRPDQRAALNDVGGWLETRLVREPKIDVSGLLVELGWLKRLARHHQAMAEEAGRRPNAQPGRGEQKSFGRRLAELERKRRDAFAAARVEAARAPAVKAQVAKPKVEEPLPEVLAVEFDDFNKARDARKAASDRTKKGRDPKEAILALVGRRGAAAGVKLVCSTTRTEGMAEVFERIRNTSGAPDWYLEASGMVKQADGVVFVGKLGTRAGA
ncbi:MAG: hypothetical protein QM820_08160 [Minicystis sp.]